MIQIINEKNIVYEKNNTHNGGSLIDAVSGTKNGFSMGISEYFADEFGKLEYMKIKKDFM